MVVSIKNNLNGRKIEPEKKNRFMNWKYILATLLFTAAVACNNDSAVQDNTDSVTHTSDTNHSSWPEPGDMTGKDSIPSPETHSDSSNLKSH